MKSALVSETVITFLRFPGSTGFGFGPFPAGFDIVEYGNIDALEAAINDDRPVGLVWVVVNAFLRLTTKPGLFEHSLRVTEAWKIVDAWLDAGFGPFAFARLCAATGGSYYLYFPTTPARSFCQSVNCPLCSGKHQACDPWFNASFLRQLAPPTDPRKDVTPECFYRVRESLDARLSTFKDLKDTRFRGYDVIFFLEFHVH